MKKYFFAFLFCLAFMTAGAETVYDENLCFGISPLGNPPQFLPEKSYMRICTNDVCTKYKGAAVPSDHDSGIYCLGEIKNENIKFILVFADGVKRESQIIKHDVGDYKITVDGKNLQTQHYAPAVLSCDDSCEDAQKPTLKTALLNEQKPTLGMQTGAMKTKDVSRSSTGMKKMDMTKSIQPVKSYSTTSGMHTMQPQKVESMGMIPGKSSVPSSSVMDR